MNDSKETVIKNNKQAPAIEIDSVLNRLDELEERCTQLENNLQDTVKFDALAARIIGKKTIKKRRAKREWSEEEKPEFHARMVAAKKTKEKARQEATNGEAKKK